MFSVDTTNITNVTDVFDVIGVPFSVQMFLYLYNTVLPIVALLGNGIVIYSSIKYNLLHMDSTRFAEMGVAFQHCNYFFSIFQKKFWKKILKKKIVHLFYSNLFSIISEK